MAQSGQLAPADRFYDVMDIVQVGNIYGHVHSKFAVRFQRVG